MATKQSSKVPKTPLEDRFNRFRKKTRKVSDSLIEFRDENADLLKETDDYDEVENLIEELHVIRKALRHQIKDKSGKYVQRPTTSEYLNTYKKRLDDVSADIEELMKDYDLTDSEE